MMWHLTKNFCKFLKFKRDGKSFKKGKFSNFKKDKKDKKNFKKKDSKDSSPSQMVTCFKCKGHRLNYVIWRAKEDKVSSSQLVAGAWRAQVHGVDYAWRVFCYSCTPTHS